MTNTEELADEMQNPPRIKLRLLQGGKGPSEPPSEGNWLGEMDVGTTFVCRPKKSNSVELNLYSVVFKTEGVVLLLWKLPDNKVLEWYVDPERFSKEFEKPTILGTTPVANEEEDDERYSRRPKDLDVDATASGEHRLVQIPEEPEIPAGN